MEKPVSKMVKVASISKMPGKASSIPRARLRISAGPEVLSFFTVHHPEASKAWLGWHCLGPLTGERSLSSRLWREKSSEEGHTTLLHSPREGLGPYPEKGNVWVWGLFKVLKCRATWPTILFPLARAWFCVSIALLLGPCRSQLVMAPGPGYLHPPNPTPGFLSSLGHLGSCPFALGPGWVLPHHREALGHKAC